MIIGTRTTLTKMAQDILAGIQDRPETIPGEMPARVAEFPTAGLGRDSSFVVSVHLDTAVGFKASGYRGPAFGTWWAFGLALVGVIAIAYASFSIAF